MIRVSCSSFIELLCLFLLTINLICIDASHLNLLDINWQKSIVDELKNMLSYTQLLCWHVRPSVLFHSSIIIRAVSNFVKSATVRTCVGLYPKLAVEQPKLYGKAPAEGIDITFDYVDTWQNQHQKPEKVILGLHGLPDTYQTFTRMLNHFKCDLRVRFVAPNFPNYEDTRRTGVFWHTSEEKCHFVQDFLALLGINRIDCLVTHSYSIHTAARLWEKPDPLRIKSVAMLSPQPMVNVYRNAHFKEMARIYWFPRSRLWARLLELTGIYRHPSIPLKLTNIEQLLMLNTWIYEPDAAGNLEHRVRLLPQRKMPTILVYGDQENVVCKEGIDAIKQWLGITQDIFIGPDDQTQVAMLKASPSSSVITSYTLANARHFPHAQRVQVSCQLIENLIK